MGRKVRFSYSFSQTICSSWLPRRLSVCLCCWRCWWPSCWLANRPTGNLFLCNFAHFRPPRPRLARQPSGGHLFEVAVWQPERRPLFAVAVLLGRVGESRERRRKWKNSRIIQGRRVVVLVGVLLVVAVAVAVAVVGPVNVVCLVKNVAKLTNDTGDKAVRRLSEPALAICRPEASWGPSAPSLGRAAGCTRDDGRPVMSLGGRRAAKTATCVLGARDTTAADSRRLSSRLTGNKLVDVVGVVVVVVVAASAAHCDSGRPERAPSRRYKLMTIDMGNAPGLEEQRQPANQAASQPAGQRWIDELVLLLVLSWPPNADSHWPGRQANETGPFGGARRAAKARESI